MTEPTDWKGNDQTITDNGYMARSQYAGLAVAQALRERGLWRPGGDNNVVIERLRDMAAISNAVINACIEFDTFPSLKGEEG